MDFGPTFVFGGGANEVISKYRNSSCAGGRGWVKEEDFTQERTPGRVSDTASPDKFGEFVIADFVDYGGISTHSGRIWEMHRFAIWVRKGRSPETVRGAAISSCLSSFGAPDILVGKDSRFIGDPFSIPPAE